MHWYNFPKCVFGRGEVMLRKVFFFVRKLYPNGLFDFHGGWDPWDDWMTMLIDLYWTLTFWESSQTSTLWESAQPPLKAEFIALKCFIKDELNDIRETIEKVLQNKNLIKYREYTKNLWDKTASKNTIISLITENINNLSPSHSQLEACCKPQKHNKAQYTQVLLDDQPFSLPRIEAKEK